MILYHNSTLRYATVLDFGRNATMQCLLETLLYMMLIN